MRPLALILAVTCSAVGAQAQNVPADAVQEIQRQQAEQSERLDQRAAEQRPTDVSPQQAPPGPDPFAPAAGGPCFQIETVELSGFEPFETPPPGYQALVGTCATAADIGAALNRINQHYQDLGYITTRAYVPEQDVADGSLAITIVPGRVERYVYGDGSPADARLSTAFPSPGGSLLNLRDLEQGLEAINAPKSARGRFQLIPGAAAGGSLVQVAVEDTRPWHLSFSLNTLGFDSTGQEKATLDFGYDNALGINDQLRFSLVTTPFEQRDDRFSDAVALNWTAPFGYWRFGLDLSYSQYLFTLEGINQSFEVEGRGNSVQLSAERVLARGQVSKLAAYADLKLSSSRSFIDGFEIESQRRRLSVLSLGLRGDRNLPAGYFGWAVGGRFGLDAFGAGVLDASIVDPTFRLVQARLDYQRAVGPGGLVYKGVFSAQHSGDVLPGTEQVSIGSWSNVRGFHDDSIYGDTGLYLRNTLEWDAFENPTIAVRMNAGFDFGYVEPSELRSWSQDFLIGASVGADITIRNRATLTVQVAQALSRPEDNPPGALPAFEASETIGYIGLKVSF
ncbi:ShlB/FhaC/HecB family hemolysin secretion/activation protein [uncultured Tateyamaria sp.]|uniref:ShlB/FhaC/HecB family hemolysin secretion/activation protein n=1 Tax=uncultured Tateyamaria sp. TaxID=455651 RepID=UPI00262E656E|nr:ShlB/FhaC/HecB family hemolysin secretion/activation protein [uncultured Tateyamaria sp.]